VLKPDDYQPNIVHVGLGHEVPPSHPDCEKAGKEVDLFDSDSPPNDIGIEEEHKGRRYVVTVEPRIMETMLKPHWTVVGVWLDPPSGS
jgi:hypothetical protein